MKFLALSTLLAAMSLPAIASTSEASDTVCFSTRNVVLEDNPNAGQYNISLYSDDGAWKVQLNYHSSTSMFGTFTNDDFDLSGSGRYYNYARNPKNDMVFYSFTDMEVTVSDQMTVYHVSANCLASNNVRFLIEGFIDVPVPTDTICSDLGYAQRVDNAFYGTHTFKAENARYSLAYGIVADSPEGTFYTADILMPELFDKQRGEMLALKSASALHEQRGDTLWLTLDALADDLTLYHLTMYNAPHEVEIVAEDTIVIEGDIALQDLTEMYGCYQLAGQNAEWGVGIAFVPEAFDDGRTAWGMDDIFMPYTTLIRLSDNHVVSIHDVSVTLEVTDEGQMIFRAEITSIDGILYHVTLMTAGRGYLGTPDEVVSIELDHAAMLDFTQMGVIGIGAYATDQCQIRVYLNAYQLQGDYYTDDAVLDMCDVMMVEGNTFVFHDARRVNTHFEAGAEGVTHATIDMLAVDNVLYHVTFDIPALRCLTDCSYSLDEALMVALQETQGSTTSYTLQFQRLPEDADELDVITDGEIFTFSFTPESEGIAGEYGYSAGTLLEDVQHTIYEQGTEVRLSSIAGTLTLTPLEKVCLDDFDDYHTSLYDIQFQFVAPNGVIYQGEGQNILLCIDDDGNFVEVEEPALSLIRTVAPSAARAAKAIVGSHIIIDSRFNLDGTAAE